MIALLDRHEELALLEAWRHHRNGSARARLVAAFEPLCRRWAWRYAQRGGDVDDLSQEARMGLMIAIDKFDLASGVRLATYARFWIQHCVERSLQIGASGVHVPITARRKLRIAAAQRDPGQAPDGLGALAQAGMGDFAASPIASGEDWEEGAFLTRSLTDDPDPQSTFAESATRASRLDHVSRALDDLDARRRLIVERRFFSDPPQTLEDIAQVLDITRERVRQLEQSAIARLRSVLQEAG
ncbi:MAG: sigma-70 family RNA polymerase sigma factor [Alphaproteobacteria bacterium]|nr:sigma-70 family RNA polymerase sigma factor [Alphaproteobacteria bacterium]